jgi:hypothetical protein
VPFRRDLPFTSINEVNAALGQLGQKKHPALSGRVGIVSGVKRDLGF